MKDNFSLQSDNYARYRPTYPKELFAYLASIVAEKQNAWDCGTGNGQVAYELSKMFKTVFATDISQSQIEHAVQVPNIHYSVQPAEKTNFENGLFDLIVVAQAIHWFDFEKFYAEVKRTSRQHALICVLGYGRIEISKPIDKLISHFYSNVIGKYWDSERRYIDENYQTIPFPFDEIPTPAFANTFHWNLEHFIGYLNTWSAVKHYISQNGHNPVDELQKELAPYWNKAEMKKVRFPLLLRVGKARR